MVSTTTASQSRHVETTNGFYSGILNIWLLLWLPQLWQFVSEAGYRLSGVLGKATVVR